MSEIRTAELEHLLRALGITANYVSYQHMRCATALVIEDPDRLMLVTKWLYPEVAKRCGASSCAVERSIRTAAARAWTNNADLLNRLAGRSLQRRPRASEFLALMAAGVSERADGKRRQNRGA